jgi:hypothetical protein
MSNDPHAMPTWHGTTILSVRRGGKVVVFGGRYGWPVGLLPGAEQCVRRRAPGAEQRDDHDAVIHLLVSS